MLSRKDNTPWTATELRHISRATQALCAGLGEYRACMQKAATTRPVQNASVVKLEVASASVSNYPVKPVRPQW